MDIHYKSDSYVTLLTVISDAQRTRLHVHIHPRQAIVLDVLCILTPLLLILK